jgi:hypothetical protein
LPRGPSRTSAYGYRNYSAPVLQAFRAWYFAPWRAPRQFCDYSQCVFDVASGYWLPRGNAYQYRNNSHQYCKRSGLGILPRGVPRGNFANIHSVHLLSRHVIGCPEAMFISIAVIHTSIGCIPALVFYPVACPEPIFCDYYDVYLISSQVTGCPEARPEPMLMVIEIIHTSIASGRVLVFCPVACPEAILRIFTVCI